MHFIRPASVLNLQKCFSLQKSLALFGVFCVFVCLSDSACFTALLELGAKQCVYGNSKHPVGSTWTNGECLRCTCSSDRMECCDMMGRVASKTKGCIVKYDYKTCTFDVFHPTDPTTNCAYSAVGK
ncbi:beta-microseminoprotein-like isoform X2 [Garra rufa]|uniref:beta-microseminoprotein-like isoform X2 n=1 Tax=Garra rufa TaxID=137080 RepID=UPI003CCE71CA